MMLIDFFLTVFSEDFGMNVTVHERTDQIGCGVINDIVRENFHIAEKVAASYATKSKRAVLDDLVSAGSYGLWKGAVRWVELGADPEMKTGILFKAVRWEMKTHIKRAIENKRNSLNITCESNIASLYEEDKTSFFDTLCVDEGPSLEAADPEVWIKITTVLRHKMPKQLLILNLFYREGWSLAEIAKFLSASSWESIATSKNRTLGLLRESRSLKAWMEGRTRRYKRREISNRVDSLKRNESRGLTFKIVNVRNGVRCPCATLDCSGKATKRGRCLSCYEAMRNNSAMECETSGCGGPARYNTLCQKCWRKERKSISY
jgi:hypothetical protein